MKYNIECLEYYTLNLNSIVHWHKEKMGFKLIGKKLVGQKVSSVILEKNNIRFIFTTEIPGSSEVNDFVLKHGEGIKRLVLSSDIVSDFIVDLSNKWNNSTKIIDEIRDSEGRLDLITLKFLDNNELVFCKKKYFEDVFLDSYQSIDENFDFLDNKLFNIDHIAYALHINESTIWENLLNEIFCSRTVQSVGTNDDSEIGMKMTVLQSEQSLFSNVLTEPINSNYKSQIQHFLDENKGNGIQHIAFSSKNIFETIDVLRKNGVVFTRFPDAYYNLLGEQFPDLDINRLKDYGVLCDVENDALLLQIFTVPVANRPTLFYEIIERVDNYKGFGINNIKTLFKAVQSNFS